MKKVLPVFALSTVLLLLLASAALAQNYKYGAAASASATATASASASPSAAATATATASATASSSATASAVNSAKSKDFAGLVDIGGGREMYMECQGTGSPTVVFVSGFPERTETWSTTLDSSGDRVFPSEQAVLPAIAETNRVCAYDRPGTVLATGPEDFEKSRSDPVPQPTTLHDGARDLHALLSASGERGPYVVVGHSLGGAISRQFASEYPQEVSGLVLIDYTPYDARKYLTDEEWELWSSVVGTPPEEALQVYPELEQADNMKNLDLVLGAAPLKPKPLIVLSADEPLDLTPWVEDGTLTPEEAKQFGESILDAAVRARADLVSQVPGARHITDTHSGHYIHQEQPQLVIDAVREVLDAAAIGSPTLGDTGGPPMVPAFILAAGLALFISSLALMRFVLRRKAS